MRQVSVDSLAKLTKKLGTEPISIIEVDWGDGTLSYADTDVGTIPGKILELGALDNVVDVLNNSSSQQIDITLDDTDGSLKDIIDSQDIHQKNVRVYQHFTGLDVADKFLVFAGKVSSPIIWSETDRTLKFTVINQLEDLEFGFSPEEGQIAGLPADLIGKPWPVIFGTCLDVPAVQIGRAVSGSTLCGVGVLTGESEHLEAPLGETSCGQGASLVAANARVSVLSIAAALYRSVGDFDESERLVEEMNDVQLGITQNSSNRQLQLECVRDQRQATVDDAKERGLGCNPLRIVGGEDFPQGRVITINVDGILLTGVMSGQDFSIHSRRHLESEDRLQTTRQTIVSGSCSQPAPAQPFNESHVVPPGLGDMGGSTVSIRGFVICTDTMESTMPPVDQVLEHKFAEAGARVTIEDGEVIGYVASITPIEVLDVKARKRFEGEERLVSVPRDYYTVSTINFGAFTATMILMNKPLSSRTDEGWSDDIFVTAKSTIGPNTVSILQWIIENYTSLDYDATSFAAVSTSLAPFPSHFAVLDRVNTLKLIRDIAFQARCAVWVTNGKFYLKYLPAEPASDMTITVSDIELGSVEVTTVETEQLVTKMDIDYKISYAEDPKKIILRNNVGKYGTKQDAFSWLIYTNADVVYHAATFWLIRLSSSWKRVSFRGFLPLLQLETFDTVTLDVPGYVASSAIKAVVEKADYDSATQTVTVQCLVPVVCGAMAEHPLFWPAAKSDTFPTQYDQPGGSGSGAQASGSLPLGTLAGLLAGSVAVGGPNVEFKAKSDRGATTPGDVGFTAGTVVIESTFADVDPTPAPRLNLKLNTIGPGMPYIPPSSSGGPTIIDIATTLVVDSRSRGSQAKLSSIVREIEGGKLIIDTNAEFGGAEGTAPFEFRLDPNTGQYIAGAAYLRD